MAEIEKKRKPIFNSKQWKFLAEMIGRQGAEKPLEWITEQINILIPELTRDNKRFDADTFRTVLSESLFKAIRERSTNQEM
jgi:hypothetical protein